MLFGLLILLFFHFCFYSNIFADPFSDLFQILHPYERKTREWIDQNIVVVLKEKDEINIRYWSIFSPLHIYFSILVRYRYWYIYFSSCWWIFICSVLTWQIFFSCLLIIEFDFFYLDGLDLKMVNLDLKMTCYLVLYLSGVILYRKLF